MDRLIDSSFLAELLPFFLALFFYKRNKGDAFFKYLIFVTFSSVLAEFLAWFVVEVLKKNNHFVFHIYLIIYFFLVSLMYKSVIKMKDLKLVFKIFFGVFISFWLYFFYDDSFFTKSIIIMFLYVASLAFMYLKGLLASDKILTYSKLLPFWVSLGFLIFYIPAIPFFSLMDFMVSRGLFFVLNTLIVLMNLILSFGIVWTSIKKQKTVL